MAEQSPAPQATPTVPDLAPQGVAVQPPPATTASVQQPTAQDPAAQLMALASQKDVSPMALVAGVVALGAGSTVLWKKISEHLNSKREAEKEKADREFELKKMEMEQKSKQGEDNHQACNVSRAALEARVVAAEQRGGAVESRLASTEQSLADLSKRVQASAEEFGKAATKAESEFTERADALSKRITKLETAAKKAASPKGK